MKKEAAPTLLPTPLVCSKENARNVALRCIMISPRQHNPRNVQTSGPVIVVQSLFLGSIGRPRRGKHERKDPPVSARTFWKWAGRQHEGMKGEDRDTGARCPSDAAGFVRGRHPRQPPAPGAELRWWFGGHTHPGRLNSFDIRDGLVELGSEYRYVGPLATAHVARTMLKEKDDLWSREAGRRRSKKTTLSVIVPSKALSKLYIPNFRTRGTQDYSRHCHLH